MIEKSAYFEVRFQLNFASGVIVFKDGSSSQAFITKRQALEIGEAMLGIRIDEHELKAIKQQIHASPLIDKNAQLEENWNKSQNRLDEMQRAMESYFREEARRDKEGEKWKDNT